MRIFLVLAAASALTFAASSAAGTTYCSPTGDYCTSVARSHGLRYLRMSTFSFGGRVRICVRDPSSARVCRAFELRKTGLLWKVKVLWKQHYPNRGAGLYRVSFFFGPTRLGPVLAFRRP